MFWRREAGASISTDLGASGDRRLVLYRPRASVNERERRDIGAGSTRKQSRDRARDRPYRMDAVKLATEGTSGHLGGLLFTEHLQMRPWRRLGPRLTRVIACSDEATGVSEARLVRECMAENARREPGSPAEADGAS